MSDRQRRAGETLIVDNRSNARRADSERNLQTQSGIGDERSRKFRKSVSQQLRFHAAQLARIRAALQREEAGAQRSEWKNETARRAEVRCRMSDVRDQLSVIGERRRRVER